MSILNAERRSPDAQRWSPNAAELEAVARRAWPAEVQEPLDGWVLRFTHAVTRRANSVWPNRSHGRVPLDEKLARAEAFYEARGIPPCYQITPACVPPDLDALLVERGYVASERTCVDIASLSEVVDLAPERADHPVEITPGITAEWFDAYAAAGEHESGRAEVRRAIMQRIRQPVGFALLRLDGAPAAIGMGVRDGEWLGVFSMGTVPAFRRRGAASTILRALALWGSEQGASRAYLQVSTENAAARALYQRLGFATLYHYHYRYRPPAVGP
jgi:GNAT superfamily N-acetyltransferase